MWYFDDETLLLTHFKLVERFGGLHGIRDKNRIHSVLETPKQQVFGQEQYPDIYQKAAVYAHNIIADHPFLDGNKRTGMTCALMFLVKNGIDVTLQPKELEDFAVHIATKHLSIAQITAWLKARTKH